MIKDKCGKCSQKIGFLPTKDWQGYKKIMFYWKTREQIFYCISRLLFVLFGGSGIRSHLKYLHDAIKNHVLL